MSRRITTLRFCIEIAVAIAAGSVEIIICQRYDADPIYGTCLFIYPLIIGLLMGVLMRGPFWIIGPATMLFYPVGMIIDIFKGGHGLNLGPLSLIFFAVLAFIGLIGAAIGRGVKLFCIKWSTKKVPKFQIRPLPLSTPA